MLPLYYRLPALALCAGILVAAEDKAGKDKDASTPSAARIVKVDAKNGTITLRMKDLQGKEVKKTFHLTQDVRMVDETGGVVTIDIFEDDEDALIVEREGRLVELRRPTRAHRARPSDLIHVLIEMSECDENCTEEVQRVYDILRRLDKNRDGKIDADDLKAARQQLVEERVDNLMKRLDKDKDRKINREEARGMIKSHFDKLDRNKDGFINREELLKAASERQDLQHSPKERK